MRSLRLGSWIFHHRLSSAESLSKVLSKPFASIMIWFLIGIALAFPIGGGLLFKNVATLTNKVTYHPSLTVFLDEGVSEEKGRQITEVITKFDDIEDVEFLTADAALIELGNEIGFQDLLFELETNPIPATLFLMLDSHLSFKDTEELRFKLLAIPEVFNVIVDHAWLERLKAFLAIGYKIVLLITISLGLASVFVISNMVRMAIESRREEIVVIKLVGGSNAFIRRPFLYIGLWYGFGGGILASIQLALAEFFLSSQIRFLFVSYEIDFVFASLGAIEAVNIAILGGLLGIIGAWGAAIRHVPLIEP